MKQKLSAVGLPLVTLLVTAALGVVWAIVHKTRLETYYTDLAYRTLADIGDAFRDRVYQYDVALNNSCKDLKGTEPCKKWEEVVRLRPDLLEAVKPRTVVPRSRLVYDFGGSAQVKLDLQSVASQITTDFFDDLILCDDEQNVLYQKSEYGRRFVKCSAILSHAGSGEEKKSDKKESGSAWVLSTEEYPFRVFDQRFELDTPNTLVSLGNPDEKAKRMPIYLTVLGLVRQQRLESEVLAFPFTLSFTFMFVVFLAFFSIPMARVSLLRPNQRLRRWDGAWLTASTYFTASLLTFGLLTLVYYSLEAGPGIDRRLEQIAKEVEANAGAELSNQRRTLDKVMADARQLCETKVVDPKTGMCPERAGPGKLAEFVPPFSFDPTLDLVAFTGLNGKQVAKWTMKPDTPANLIEVNDRGFFRAVFERRMWNYRDGAVGEPFFLEPLVSRTTAENVVVQSILPKPDPGMVVNITSRPSSLFGVFVQPGFGFAIIDGHGKILFHSQQSRNLRDNLFDDCMDAAGLRSAVNGRSFLNADVNYLGRDHRFRMTPLHSFSGSPWSLAVFYDREHLRSTLAGVITVTLALFLGYTLLAMAGLIVLVTLGFLRSVRVSGFANPVVLLWPDEQTHGSYRGLIAWFATLLVVELVALATLSPLALTCLVTIMPLMALALSQAWLRLFRWHTAPFVRHLRLRRRYTLASALLLILATVAPCTAFFRMAFDYEMGLEARHEMAALMRHLHSFETETRANLRRHLRSLTPDARTQMISEFYRQSKKAPSTDTGDNGQDEYVELYLKSRVETDIRRGVYSCATLAPKPGMNLQHQASRAAECPFPISHRWMPAGGRAATSSEQWPAPVKRWLPGLYDTLGEQRFGVATSKDPLMVWNERDDDLELESRSPILPDLRVRPLFLKPSPWALAGFLVMLGLIFAWMFFLNRRLFLFDLANALSLSHQTPIPAAVKENLLVLVSPCHDGAMSWNERPDLQKIDLAIHNGATAFERAEATARGTEIVGIVLNHFEDRIDTPEVLEDRIRLIEQLTAKARPVIVLSAVDPHYHLSNTLTDPVVRKLIVRLDAALSGFTYRMVFEGASISSGETRRAEQAPRAEQALPAPGQVRFLSDEFFPIVMSECEADDWLKQNVQDEIREDLVANPRAGDPAVLDEITRRAEPRYLALWNLCSPPEKLLLRQLAEEGLVNPDSREALRELIRKRLLVRNPYPHFMNASFRLWVRALPEMPELLALEQAGEGGWDKWRNIVWPALFVCVLFLLATQRKYFDNIVPFLSALGAEITALMKMVNAVKSASGKLQSEE